MQKMREKLKFKNTQYTNKQIYLSKLHLGQLEIFRFTYSLSFLLSDSFSSLSYFLFFFFSSHESWLLLDLIKQMLVAVYFSEYNSYSYSWSQFDIYINITTLTHSPFRFRFPFCFHFCSRCPFPSSSSSFSYIHCYSYCQFHHYQSNTEHITNSNFKSMD